MILDFRISGFMVYSDEVELSMRADTAIKKFDFNVFHEKGCDVLKSVCVYGANNSGKTCLVRAVESMTDVLSGKPGARERLDGRVDIFSEEKICRLGVTFLYGGVEYSYDFGYAAPSAPGRDGGFVYECMKRADAGKDGKRTETTLFLRDVERGEYVFRDDEGLQRAMGMFSTENILIYTVDESEYPAIGECRKILCGFASGVDVVCMSDAEKAGMSGVRMPHADYPPLMKKTIEMLNADPSMRGKVERFVKLADLDIDSFDYWKYLDVRPLPSGTEEPEAPFRRASDAMEDDDVYRMVTRHRRGNRELAVRSYVVDSVGTLKVMALAGFMIDALENGRVLVVDELDSGLHFRLTRAFALLFNDEENRGAQLIFTTHDTALLDSERLFREDQIWFTAKDDEGACLYSVADVEDGGDGAAHGDLFHRYRLGEFGAIPRPDLTPLLDDDGKEE